MRGSKLGQKLLENRWHIFESNLTVLGVWTTRNDGHGVPTASSSRPK